ncbi:MAG: subclass B3 metallo-beta-lactamase [Bacteroidota bacterium]|nr:subclass B3 metallo-beta-lactamase [Bacteroidota bacterium]
MVGSAMAQPVKEPAGTPAEWSKPYAPFRIAGNLYYVGSYDLASYLITTPKGNILINTGLASSYSQIQQNMESLGFRFQDIKILLTTQAHYDHMGAMAAIQKSTGARLMADAREADVLASGGKTDYALGKLGTTYQPVHPDRLLYDGDTISLGGMHLVMLHHPGHTKGSCSYLFTVRDEKRSYRVLIANLPTIVTDQPLNSIKSYPEAVSDFAYTLQAMKKISFDLWLASHASQFHLHDKHHPGDTYTPYAFKDQKGYETALSELQKAYQEKREQDKKN